MPAHLSYNRFIVHGYQPPRPRITPCSAEGAAAAFESLFSLHNETANIWTHALGVLLTVFISVAGPQMPPAISLCLAAGGLCFSLSVAYHAGLHVGGSRGYAALLAADLAGVWAVNAGLAAAQASQLAPCWPPLARIALWAAPAAAAAFGLVAGGMASPTARATAFAAQALVRAAAPLLLAAYGASHWVASDIRTHLALELAAAAGAVANVARLPERWWPALGHACSSHTVMHVVVAAVFFTHHSVALDRQAGADMAAAACADDAAARAQLWR